jgi:ferrous iron transport protein B
MKGLLVGNPNCGKTTLFNTLTGQNQRIGNWPGVTVDKKEGTFVVANQSITITDLPGIYSLSAPNDGSSQDAQIAAKAIIELQADFIINVVDACHLERHLYLTSQLLELEKPIIVALNMTDLAKQQRINIDEKALATQLGCPVVPIQAHKHVGIDALKQQLINPGNVKSYLTIHWPDTIQQALIQLKHYFAGNGYSTAQSNFMACRAVEGDHQWLSQFDQVDVLKKQDLDLIAADQRYTIVHKITQSVQSRPADASNQLTARLDKFVLNKWLAFPIFLAVMYVMFLFAINIGGAFQSFFDIASEAIFVDGTAWVLQQLHSPLWLIALLANGAGKGINTTVTFIPVIAAMFFFLAALESSGYMARAAFVVDRLMRFLGLPGKSFVPMIVGFGCNVPAIMAARTLDNERDRLLTILMSPFMSCSARLAIYAVFVAAFFPTGGQNVVFSLYLLGIIMAVLTGLLLRKTHLKGTASPLILELPTYHRPTLISLLKQMKIRLMFFIKRAGRLIIPICVILGGLNALSIDGQIIVGDASRQSILSWFAQWLTPLFSPMGIQPENWPATVGLISGTLAKEVVVGTLNALYAQMGNVAHLGGPDFNLWASLKEAVYSVIDNLSSLAQAIANPILASAPDNEVSQVAYGEMAKRFDGAVGAYAYLLFVLLYVPCVSTMAAVRQEASRAWMWFSITWSFVLAYAVAVVFYQLATIAKHPESSIAWVCAMFAMIALYINWMRIKSRKNQAKGEHYVVTSS